MSATNHTTGFHALPPARAMLHDMVSLAICLGGLVLVIFTGTGAADDGYALQRSLKDSQYGAAFTLRRLMNAAHWFLIAVMYAAHSCPAQVRFMQLTFCPDCGDFSFRHGHVMCASRMRRRSINGCGTVNRWKKRKCMMHNVTTLITMILLSVGFCFC